MSQFECPICGGENYIVLQIETVTAVNTNRSGLVDEVKTGDSTIGYECGNCTVMFGDPERFSKHREPGVNAKHLAKNEAGDFRERVASGDPTAIAESEN